MKQDNTSSRPAPGATGEKPSVIAAVFDVDRTLVPITTTERIFIRFLARKGVLGPTTVAKTLLFVMLHLHKMSPFEAIRRQRAYLAGQPYAKMRALAEECFESDIKPRVSAAGLAAIREHKGRGETIILLSGSLDFLLEPLQQYVQADHLIAAHMEVVKGKLTGRILGHYPYGSLKATIMQHFAREHGLDFSRSYAYADHHTDHEILRLFGNPVVINARPKMQEIARREGWPMRDFK